MSCDRCFHLHEVGDSKEMLFSTGYSDVDPMFNTA